jgi:hypothetical protein
MALQFPVADIMGNIDRGRNFAQAERMRPINEESARLGVEQQQQNLTTGGLQREQALVTGGLQQQNIQSQIDERTNEQKSQSLYKTAFDIESITDEQMVPFLQNNIAKIKSMGGNSAESEEGLRRAMDGDFETVRSAAKNILETGYRQGDLKRPQKKTASQQDFETFQSLNATAAKTNDPVDIQLAQQFGMQSGFDRDTPQELADIAVETDTRKSLGKQAATASKEAFDGLKNVRRTIGNMNDALTALNDGAATGPIISRLPSFRTASIELDNIKGRMGLDVISSVTFGALSESELAFALNVALPTNLEPEPLKDFIGRKISAQKKLAIELRKAASFLGTPGNTIADYVKVLEGAAEKQEKDEAATFKKYGL